LRLVIPGWPEGTGPEATDTDLALPFARPVFLDSGLAGHARAPE